MPQTTQAQRSEVHRKLGRCLLRVQQYERLLKAILVDHDQSGTLSNWRERREKRIEEFARKSLGQLVEVMQASLLKTHDDDEPSGFSKAPEDLTEIWFSCRTSIALDPQAHERTIKAVKDLVALRNEFVHHLLERFDLWSIEECSAADAYLDQSYATVDRHMDQLLDWGRTVDHALQASAGAMASIDPLELLRSTPAGDQGLAQVFALNQNSNIVGCLREAEALLGMDGWTLLDDAIVFIARIDAQEYPARYGCRNWRQVLRGCGIFEMQRVALPERKGLYTVYRTLPNNATASGPREPQASEADRR